MSEAKIYDATVTCYDVNGKELGKTGGMTYHENEKKARQFYTRKLKGMLRRGYFTGTVNFRIDFRTVNFQ